MLWVFVFQLIMNGALALDIIEPYKKPGTTLRFEDLTLQFFEEFDGKSDKPTGCGYELADWKNHRLLIGSLGKNTFEKCQSLETRLISQDWKKVEERQSGPSKFKKQYLSYARAFQYVPCEASLKGQLAVSPHMTQLNLQTQYKQRQIEKNYKIMVKPDEAALFSKNQMPIEFEGVIHFIIDRPQKVEFYFKTISLPGDSPSKDLTKQFNSEVKVVTKGDRAALKSRLRAKDASLLDEVMAKL